MLEAHFLHWRVVEIAIEQDEASAMRYISIENTV